MAGRYLVTGTQLGILKACLLESREKEKRIGMDAIDEIIDKQFLCNSNSDVCKDIESLTNLCLK
jgi:hypothetical protein